MCGLILISSPRWKQEVLSIIGKKGRFAARNFLSLSKEDLLGSLSKLTSFVPSADIYASCLAMYYENKSLVYPSMEGELSDVPCH